MLSGLINFINHYFIQPMYTRSGYNAYNTFLYAFLFGVGVIFSYRYIIKPLKIKVDGRLFLAVTPMVVFGATVRALVDGGVLPENPLILTPGIFFTAFALIVPALIADAKLRTYPKVTVGWGTLLALWANYLLITHAKNWYPYEVTVGLTLISWVGALLWYKIRPFEREYLYVVLAHLYDMGSTVGGIYFWHYHEVHWIEHYLVQRFGPFIYYPWITFILIVVYYALKYLVPDPEERRFWYLALYILGLGPAVRDPAQMVLQV